MLEHIRHHGSRVLVQVVPVARGCRDLGQRRDVARRGAKGSRQASLLCQERYPFPGEVGLGRAGADRDARHAKRRCVIVGLGHGKGRHALLDLFLPGLTSPKAASELAGAHGGLRVLVEHLSIGTSARPARTSWSGLLGRCIGRHFVGEIEITVPGDGIGDSGRVELGRGR